MKSVHASIIGVGEVNMWTHCNVTNIKLLLVFDSELASLGNRSIDASELGCGVRCIAVTCSDYANYASSNN